MKSVPFLLVALLALACVTAAWLLWSLTGGAQFILALIAAATMALLGYRITTNQGHFSHVGQLEKLAILAALLLSTVSAITTSLGLWQLLSTNPSTGPILIMGMSLLIGGGIQILMLLMALRLGESIQALIAFHPQPQPQHSASDAAGHALFPWNRKHARARVASRHRYLYLLAAAIFLLLGAMLVAGIALPDIVGHILQAVFSQMRQQDVLRPIIGFTMLAAGIFLAYRAGLILRPRTLLGFILLLVFYLVLLMVSSGFGFLNYFNSLQSPQVQALDRDSHLKTQSVALANQIKEAALQDENDAFVAATSRGAFQELQARLEKLAVLFEHQYEKLRARIEAERARLEEERARLLERQQERLRIVQKIESLKIQIEQAESDVKDAEEIYKQLEPQLTKDWKAAKKREADALAGRDPTGVPRCGPICRRAAAEAQRFERKLENLKRAVTEKKKRLSDLKVALAAAEKELEVYDLQLSAAGGQAPGKKTAAAALALPPLEQQKRVTFHDLLAKYSNAPKPQILEEIAARCTWMRAKLLEAEVELPKGVNCDVSRVKAMLKLYEQRKQARIKAEQVCGELPAQAKEPQQAPTPALQRIPQYLQARLAWLDRCLAVANTGSQRMQHLAVLVKRLRNEYGTTGYDARRVINALLEGNKFALFSAFIAVLVDTGILVAGLMASAYKGRELARYPGFVAPAERGEKILRALRLINPTLPQEAALQLSGLWRPRPAAEVGNSPYTHELHLTPTARTTFGPVLDAAGSFYARYEREEDGASLWLLHENFVQMVLSEACAHPYNTRTKYPVQAEVLPPSYSPTDILDREPLPPRETQSG